MKTYLTYFSVLNANLELHLQQMGMEFGGGVFCRLGLCFVCGCFQFSKLASNTFGSLLLATSLLISEPPSVCVCFQLSLSRSNGRSDIMEVLEQERA